MAQQWSVAIFICLGWIISVCLHEFGHAIVAYWGGDTSVKDKGYLTLNPLKYTNVGLSLVLPLLFLLMGGIALPGAAVYINEKRLRNRWWKSAVSAAGPIASVIVALVLTAIFPFVDRNSWIHSALACLIYLELYVIIINSLPIPPLDGYGMIEPWLPQPLQIRLRKFARFGIIVLFMLLWSVEPFGQFLSQVSFLLAQWLGIDVDAIAIGFSQLGGTSGILLLAVLAVGLIVRRLLQKPYEVWYDRGKAKANTGKYEDAIAAFDKATEIKDDYYPAWYEKSNSQKKLNRYEAALFSCQKALQIKPNDSTELWNQQGRLFYLLDRYEESIASFERALQIDPEDVYSLGACGWSLEELERYEEALEYYQKALRIDPDNSLILGTQGKSLFNLQRYQEALSSYEKALAIDKNFYIAWRDMGVILEHFDRHQEALNAYEKAIQIKPDGVEVLRDRGRLLYWFKQYEEALETFERLLAVDTNNYYGWLKRGMCLDKLQRYEEAIESCDRAIEIQPNDATIWSVRSGIFYNQKRYEDAIASYDRAIEIDSTRPDLWYNKACCYALQGNIDIAIENLQKAIALNPDEYIETAASDRDFDNLKENERFKKLINGQA